MDRVPATSLENRRRLPFNRNAISSPFLTLTTDVKGHKKAGALRQWHGSFQGERKRMANSKKIEIVSAPPGVG